MKKICFFVLAIAFCVSSYAQYVDLGLPSGTKWKVRDEGGDNDFYTYDEAIKAFGNNLPTKEQWAELIEYCHWIYIDALRAFKVTGKNGTSIFLHCKGRRECDGKMMKESEGFYWSSTPSGSSGAWFIELYVDDYTYLEEMFEHYRCTGMSVRLVQK